MNIRIDYYDDQELTHTDRAPRPVKVARPSAARRTSNPRRAQKGPVQVNGIHRRRRKRINW